MPVRYKNLTRPETCGASERMLVAEAERFELFPAQARPCLIAASIGMRGSLRASVPVALGWAVAEWRHRESGSTTPTLTAPARTHL